MSCNNTNSTCTSCNHNYSSCNNKCAKCGCRDSFLTSPPPCPTPQGCPDPIPCQEVLSSDCIIYNGPNILCNGDIIVYSDDTWTEILENIVDYFCVPPIPEILCGEDVVVIEDSTINEALEDIVSYICDNLTTANNGLTMSPTSNNVQLGGTLLQSTTIQTSTFALTLQGTSSSPILNVNQLGTSATSSAIKGTSTGGFAGYFEGTGSSLGAVYASMGNITYPTITIIHSGGGIPGKFLRSGINTTGIDTILDLYNICSTGPATTGLGAAINFSLENSGSLVENAGNIAFDWISANSGAVASRFSIKTVNSSVASNSLEIANTGQLKLNEYGAGTFTGIPTYNLSTTVGGDIIETTAGLFGTAFRGYISPDSFTFKTFNLLNSKIELGDAVIFDTTNGIIEYQIKDGVNFSQYNQTTGIWTCPQTGKYDINYNVFLTAPTNTYGWGEVGGTFTIGVTQGGTIIYCADTFTAVKDFYYSNIYMTGGIQGKIITAGTQIALRIQNLTGVAYTQIPSRDDNIDWAIRRVG